MVGGWVVVRGRWVAVESGEPVGWVPKGVGRVEAVGPVQVRKRGVGKLTTTILGREGRISSVVVIITAVGLGAVSTGSKTAVSVRMGGRPAGGRRGYTNGSVASGREGRGYTSGTVVSVRRGRGGSTDGTIVLVQRGRGCTGGNALSVRGRKRRTGGTAVPVRGGEEVHGLNRRVGREGKARG